MLITGVFLHAWGMFDKHRLERGSAVHAPWWSTALYILCWTALLLLAVYIMGPVPMMQSSMRWQSYYSRKRLVDRIGVHSLLGFSYDAGASSGRQQDEMS